MLSCDLFSYSSSLGNGKPTENAIFQRACYARHCRWSDILKQPYLGGDKPSAADFGLLGQFQCMASGLTDQTLPLVLEYPRLMLWLETMHHRLDGYERLHSLRFICPNSTVKSAHLSSQIYFYISLSLAILAFPITFIFLVYALLKRGKNASRTGALSSTW